MEKDTATDAQSLPSQPQMENQDLFELINDNADFSPEEKKKLYELLVHFSHGEGDGFLFQFYFIMKMILKSTTRLPDIISEKGDLFIGSCEKLIDIINKPNLEILRTNISELKQNTEDIKTVFEVEARNAQKDIESARKELQHVEDTIEQRKAYLDEVQAQAEEKELAMAFDHDKRKWGSYILMLSLFVSVCILLVSLYAGFGMRKTTTPPAVSAEQQKQLSLLSKLDFLQKEGNLYVRMAEPFHVFRTEKDHVKYGKVLNSGRH